MTIEKGREPINENFGTTPVRLNPEEDGEVVWGRRIDPVRVRIESIPFPRSGFRHGDIVLHDGAPVGYREYDGREYAVFNALELFESSPYSTYEAELWLAKQEDIEVLQAICNENDIVCEDWTTSVRNICRQCSEGRPHEHHDHENEEHWRNRHSVGLAATEDSVVRHVLERWGNPDRRVECFEFSIGPK